MGIDRTRASKARAIYRTFANEKDVAGIPVEDAYAQRQRVKKTKQPADESSAPKKDVKKLRGSVARIASRTGTVVHDAAFAAPEEAAILIPAVRKAIRELEELLALLEEQAGAAAATRGRDPTGSREMA